MTFQNGLNTFDPKDALKIYNCQFPPEFPVFLFSLWGVFRSGPYV